jgi:hypothetical protein
MKRWVLFVAAQASAKRLSQTQMPRFLPAWCPILWHMTMTLPSQDGLGSQRAE